MGFKKFWGHGCSEDRSWPFGKVPIYEGQKYFVENIVIHAKFNIDIKSYCKITGIFFMKKNTKFTQFLTYIF
jgi:hypothetical protein